MRYSEQAKSAGTTAIELHRSAVAASRRLRRKLTRQTGLTLVETLLIVAVIGILAAFTAKPMMCYYQKSRMASRISDLSQARDLVDGHKAELGFFPEDLGVVFDGPSAAPPHLIYCADDEDGNKGHGNEFCTFFDPDNPSDNNPPQSMVGGGYILMTDPNLCPCLGVDFAWVSSGGRVPLLIGYDGKTTMPGHPGQGPGGPGGGKPGG